MNRLRRVIATAAALCCLGMVAPLASASASPIPHKAIPMGGLPPCC